MCDVRLIPSVGCAAKTCNMVVTGQGTPLVALWPLLRYPASRSIGVGYGATWVQLRAKILADAQGRPNATSKGICHQQHTSIVKVRSSPSLAGQRMLSEGLRFTLSTTHVLDGGWTQAPVPFADMLFPLPVHDVLALGGSHSY
jgi:hypothetical protein